MVDQKFNASPSVWDTFHNLCPDSKVFVVNDLLQVRLSSQAKPFCFVTQRHGLLTYGGPPQGFAGSSDELINATNVAFTGFPIIEMMDDIIFHEFEMKIVAYLKVLQS